MTASTSAPPPPPAAQPPTELTRGLLNALDRPPLDSITPSTAGTLVGGLLTAGIYPAIALPRKWQKAVRLNQNVLWHLAEWTTVNVGVDEGRWLHRQFSGRLPILLASLAWLSGVLALAAMAVGVLSGFELLSFWRVDPVTTLGDPIYTSFLAGLLGSYFLTWLSVNTHLRGMHRARGAFERMTSQLAPTPGLAAARWQLGIRPVSTLLGLVLMLAGFAWALPMLIAATAQRRTLLIHSRRINSRLAHRLRELMERRRPVVALPPVVDRVGLCRNAVCDQVLPPDALYCARCGTPQRVIARVLD